MRPQLFLLHNTRHSWPFQKQTAQNHTRRSRRTHQCRSRRTHPHRPGHHLLRPRYRPEKRPLHTTNTTRKHPEPPLAKINVPLPSKNHQHTHKDHRCRQKNPPLPRHPNPARRQPNPPQNAKARRQKANLPPHLETPFHNPQPHPPHHPNCRLPRRNRPPVRPAARIRKMGTVRCTRLLSILSRSRHPRRRTTKPNPRRTQKAKTRKTHAHSAANRLRKKQPPHRLKPCLPR